MTRGSSDTKNIWWRGLQHLLSPSGRRVLILVLGVAALYASGALVRPAGPMMAATPAGQGSQETTEPAARTEDAARQDSMPLAYSREAIWLVLGVFTLLAFLFVLLLWWAGRLEQASYLGQLYHDSVKDLEYGRLAAPLREKLAAGGYREDVVHDSGWLTKNHRPAAPGAPPGYSSTSPTEQDSTAYIERRREYDKRKQEYDEWEEKVTAEAMQRYRKALGDTEAKAEVRAASAANVDFGVLRGRGAEFVLEFTTIVVLIFAATALGILGILQRQQIGTLLAAIAGYVLGRASSRTQGGAGERAGAVEERRTPVDTAQLTELVRVVGDIARSPVQTRRREPAVEDGSPTEQPPVEAGRPTARPPAEQPGGSNPTGTGST